MIDWSKPIELDTVPPRPARAVLPKEYGHAHTEVIADFDGYGEVGRLRFTDEGVCNLALWDIGEDIPNVRNVPTDDVTAELLAALKEIADLPGEINPSNYDHDDACELNRQFCYAITLAADVVAKAEART